ncbi:MAG: D-alanine--D-alanine ligase [Cyanobacteria bacterium M5B4]|nr:MAG: D-alanine--D-alanine ligase [Cyanobacteria bacterium M5B4]
MKILQLVGSPTNDFYAKLSLLYAKDAIDALSVNDRYTFIIAYISDKGWRFPSSLKQEDLDRAEVLTLAQGIDKIQQMKPDLALPQMFCLAGMTTYRSLLELLNIPYIGNKAYLMALTANKAHTKTIVANAGVKVPKGELLYKNARPILTPPVVVKPIDADNSIGVSLVREEAEYDPALQIAFSHSDRVLVEEFISGREVRCGILQLQDELLCLPLEEYALDDRYPIRTVENKIKTTTAGELSFAAKDPSKSWIISPDLDDLTPKVWEAACKCHRALDCRHYSLFDFRISKEGEPYFLEAGLYCSFSPKSVIVTMAANYGMKLTILFDKMVASITESKRSLPESVEGRKS